MTIKLGWWVLPIVITLVAFIVAKLLSPTTDYSHRFAGEFEYEHLILFLAALTVSLISWLIWALLT